MKKIILLIPDFFYNSAGGVFVSILTILAVFLCLIYIAILYFSTKNK